MILTPYKECPVPENQQPRNEYNLLRKSYFFAFTTLSFTQYLSKLIRILFVILIISSFLISACVDLWSNPFDFLFITIIFSNIIIIFILLRTYLGWSYISKRLLSATIVYEESGWYDGEIWIKTPVEIAQDRLVAQYTIKPILKRIQISTQFLLLSIILMYGIINY